MGKVKIIKINVNAAKDIVRLLDRLEKLACADCSGQFHEPSCPAKDAFQLRNYLTQRINNPDKEYGI